VEIVVLSGYAIKNPNITYFFSLSYICLVSTTFI